MTKDVIGSMTFVQDSPEKLTKLDISLTETVRKREGTEVHVAFTFSSEQAMSKLARYALSSIQNGSISLVDDETNEEDEETKIDS
jgi:hypothetical protein